MKRWHAVIVALMGLLMGCPGESASIVVEEDSNSGGDERLAGALALFEVVNDRIDAPAGDNTDYRWLELESPGYLTLRLRLFQPGVEGFLSIHNEYGIAIEEVRINAADENAVIERFRAFPGRYYLRVYASAGASDYALGQELDAD